MKNLSLLFFCVQLLAISCNEKRETLPNMVFIIADDVSWNDFACYGNEDVRTPNIDKLASGGIKLKPSKHR
jgi:hypothetical protein